MEVGFIRCVALGVAAHPGRSFSPVLHVTLVHVVGHAYVAALVHLVLDAIDVDNQQSVTVFSTFTAYRTGRTKAAAQA